MPAPTIVSSKSSMIGPPASDGTFWARYEFTTSTGQIITVENVASPAGTDIAAELTALSTVVLAQLSIVPSPVTLSQARQAVLNAGLRPTVEAAVAQSTPDVQNLWYCASQIERDHPALIALAAAIGLSSDQLDDLFRQAAAL